MSWIQVLLMLCLVGLLASCNHRYKDNLSENAPVNNNQIDAHAANQEKTPGKYPPPGTVRETNAIYNDR